MRNLAQRAGARHLLFPLLALLVLAGCGPAEGGSPDDGFTIQNPYDGLWQNRAEAPIRFELEQVFGADEEPFEAVVGGVSYPIADDAGNVYFFDRSEHRVVSFDKDGAFRWSVGREGQGPGEFQDLRGMVWNGADRLYVLNQQGSRLEEYGTDGSYLGSAPVEVDSLRVSRLAGFIAPGLFVFTRSTSGRLGTTIAIARRADPWQLVARIDEDQTGDLPEFTGVSAGPDVSVVGDKIAVSHLEEYRLALYDTTGTRVRVIRRDMHDLVRPGLYVQGGRRAIGMYGGLGPSVRLAGGHLLAMANWPPDVADPDEHIRQSVESGEWGQQQYAHTLDLYDANDRLLYSLSGEGYAPEIGNLAFVDRSGRLYTTSSNPFPQMRRYRVVIEE